MKIKTLTMLLLALTTLGVSAKSLPSLDAKLNSAYAYTKQNTLIVGTGRMERRWQLTPQGLATTSITNSESQKVWNSAELDCDWSIVGITDSGEAQIVGITSATSTDERFTSEHLDIVAELYYPSTKSNVQYHIWVYPNATGVRTQLYVKSNSTSKGGGAQITNNLTFKTTKGSRKAGYANDGVVEKYFATAIEGKEQIEVQMLGIDLNKNYKIGMSFWCYDKAPSGQTITIASVDGENRKVVASNIQTPVYKQDKAQPKLITYDLPTDILLDGSCRIMVDNSNGSATVSEIFVYQEGAIEQTLTGDIDRLSELTSQSPKGYALTAYFDCGEAASGAPTPYNGYVDRLPVDARKMSRSYVGYYNDTQHRNTAETPLIKELSTDNEVVNWASIVAVDHNKDGIVMLKESHKCVNQYGVDTGDFRTTPNGLQSSGLGLSIKEITDCYKWCWASWSIVYAGDEVDRALAIKEFDRARYPIDPERDIYIQANTWGSDRNKEGAREENILLELEVQNQLGVDIQQIDDGWQNNNTDWELRTDWYPNGWAPVRQKAADMGVKLGLWGAAMPIKLEDLKRAYDQGGFISYKLDFASLGNHKNMDDLMHKIRSFVEYTDHKVRVNWDLTENAPRFGYYWAKEYGCVYLENRKPTVPTNVIYVPYLVLRDCWHLSKYTNINKFQTSTQNVEMVKKSASDAHLHTQSYATAISLSGVPLLFMETHMLNQSQRQEMKAIFDKYKLHRQEMFNCYVFPIGEEPNNKSWAGFQYIGKDSGYLLIFRELNNNETSRKIALEHLENCTVELVDVMNDQNSTIKVDAKGEATFTIGKGGDFRLYRYQVK